MCISNCILFCGMVDYVLLYTTIDCVLCYGYSFQSTQSPSVSQGVTCNLHYKQDKEPSSQLLKDITIHILVYTRFPFIIYSELGLGLTSGVDYACKNMSHCYLGILLIILWYTILWMNYSVLRIGLKLGSEVNSACKIRNHESHCYLRILLFILCYITLGSQFIVQYQG